MRLPAVFSASSNTLAFCAAACSAASLSASPASRLDSVFVALLLSTCLELLNFGLYAHLSVERVHKICWAWTSPSVRFLSPAFSQILDSRFKLGVITLLALVRRSLAVLHLFHHVKRGLCGLPRPRQEVRGFLVLARRNSASYWALNSVSACAAPADPMPIVYQWL